MLDFCRKALDAYGNTGDQTLEYIGFTLGENGGVEQRVYRKKTPLLAEQLKKEKPYDYILGEMMAPFCQKESISLCDVSKSSALGESTFRTIFRLPKKQNKDEAERDISGFFSCFPDDMGYRERFTENYLKYGRVSGVLSPLLQIGVEVDHRNQLRGIKYYMRIQDFAQLRGLDACWEGRSEWLCDRLCENGYKPFFVGINDYGGAVEEKLYFISKSVGFKKPEILEEQKKLARDFGWDRLKGIFDGTYEMGLYAEGIAFCPQEQTWRLYFREFLGRRQTVERR